jgi:peroxiredoxin
MALLSPGDTFPKLTITVPGGQTLTLPDALAGDFGVVLFYRGSWCPYCNAQPIPPMTTVPGTCSFR